MLTFVQATGEERHAPRFILSQQGHLSYWKTLVTSWFGPAWRFRGGPQAATE